MSDIDVIKTVSGNTTKLYGWLPGMMCHILHVFGPEKYGGKGNIRIKAEEEAARTGESYDVIVERVCICSSSKCTSALTVSVNPRRSASR